MAATAEVFDEAGWLHTGDVGYYDEEGWWYIVDRVKAMIKVNGKQVSPTEIELLLNAHPSIEESAVAGMSHPRKGEVPVAFVKKKRSAQLTEADVKAHVAEQLSNEKHLAEVRFVDAIPKLAAGSWKINRRALRVLLSSPSSKL